MPAYLAITARNKTGRGYDVKLGEWVIRGLIDALREVDREYTVQDDTVSGERQ